MEALYYGVPIQPQLTLPYLASIAFGVILGIILIMICNKNGKFKTEYDERQRGFRGTGYKYAAYTTWGLLAIYTSLDQAMELPVENGFALITITFIGCMVQISYSIFKDAYWGSNSNLKKYAILFIVLTIINGLAAYVRCVNGDMIVDGKITFDGTINLQCAIMFLIIGVEILIKKLMDKAEEE